MTGRSTLVTYWLKIGGTDWTMNRVLASKGKDQSLVQNLLR